MASLKRKRVLLLVHRDLVHKDLVYRDLVHRDIVYKDLVYKDKKLIKSCNRDRDISGCELAPICWILV
jgi:hypothetical protein